MGRQHSRAEIVWVSKVDKALAHSWTKHANQGETDTGSDLYGDFDSWHGQVGAVWSPAVHQLPTQGWKGLRERRLPSGVQTWRAHHWFVQEHHTESALKNTKGDIVPWRQLNGRRQLLAVDEGAVFGRVFQSQGLKGKTKQAKRESSECNTVFKSISAHMNANPQH